MRLSLEPARKRPGKRPRPLAECRSEKGREASSRTGAEIRYRTKIRRLAGLSTIVAAWFTLLSVEGTAQDRPPRTNGETSGDSAVTLRAAVVGNVQCIAWLNDATLLAGSRDGKLSRIRAEDGALLDTWRGTDLRRIAGSERDGAVVTATDDGTIRLFDPTDASVRRTIRSVRGRVRTLAVTSTGDRVAAGARERVAIFDGRGEELRDVICPYRIRSVAFGDNGAWLAIAREDPRLQIVDVETGSTLALVREHRSPIGVVRSAPGGRLATGSDDGTVRIWEVTPGGSPRVARTLAQQPGSIADLAFDAAGKRMIVLTSSGRISLFDASTGFRLAEANAAKVTAAALSPDGSHVAMGGPGGLRIQEFLESDLAKPDVELGLELAELRVLDRAGVPIRLEVRLKNLAEERTGPLQLTAKVNDTSTGDPTSVENVDPGRLTPRLFFDLPDDSRLARVDSLRIEIEAQSRLDTSARFFHQTSVETRMPELAVDNVEVAEPTAARPVLRFELRRPEAKEAGPGPLRVQSTVRVGSDIIGTDDRVVSLDSAPFANLEVPLPADLDDAIGREPILSLSTVSTRERWPSQSFRTETTLSTRPPRLELLGHQIEVDANDIPVAIEVELANADRTRVGTLEVALVSPPLPDVAGEAELIATTLVAVPGDASFLARIQLTPELGARLAEGDDRPLRVHAYRPGWPGRAWRRPIELPNGRLELRLDSLRLAGGGPSSPGRARIAFANLERVDVGPVDLTVLIDGRPAASERFPTLPPSEPGAPPFELDLDLAADAMPRASATDFELAVRAVRPAIRGTEWIRSVRIVTGDPNLKIIDERFEPGERGAPSYLAIRFRNEADRDPGILTVRGRVSRPGRRLDSSESVTEHRLGPLAPGETTAPLRFLIPWAAIMGGVDVNGVRLEIELERSLWSGRRQRIDRTVLRLPDTDIADFAVLGDESGRPRAIRFDLVNALDLELGRARIRAFYDAGLRGAQITSAEADRILDVGPGERIGPVEIPIPESVLPVFESAEYLKVRIVTEHPDWSDLQSVSTRIVPTREPRIGLHSMNVVRATETSPPEARIILRNEDRIDSQPMRVAVDFRDANTDRSLLGEVTWLPAPPIRGRSLTGPLRFPVPSNAVEAVLAGEPVDLTIALRGSMLPVDLRRSIRPSQALDPEARSGFPWLVFLLALAIGVPALGTAVIFLRRHLAARNATTEFFALIEMDEEEEAGATGYTDDPDDRE